MIITSAEILARVQTKLPRRKSAWNRGVARYAVALAETLPGTLPEDWDANDVRRALLEGERDWLSFAWNTNHRAIPIDRREIFESIFPPSRVERELAALNVPYQDLADALEEASEIVIDSFRELAY